MNESMDDLPLEETECVYGGMAVDDLPLQTQNDPFAAFLRSVMWSSSW